MIAKLIRWSVANRFLVLLATAMLTAWGVWGVRSTPVDALPDLSDVQVIIRTSYPGQAPQIVENQVTYPLATTMLSVPGPRRCAASRSSATRSSMSCSRTAPTCTGRARGCWST
jgi:Cu(I)/Ag(I) efflux system membrane protein CusA/SilA